jgi:hypothetical protein
MAFGLGQAIAALFARIAAALASGGGGSISPLPPSPPRPPSPPVTPPSGPPPGGIIPEPPFVGTPPTPGPPPVVVVPATPQPGPPATTDPNCELLSFADRLALAGLANRESRDSTVPAPYVYTPTVEVIEMPRSFGVGIPLESTDYFRFRAISTSDVVTVSYFGRIQRPDGNIVPFLHSLITVLPNTLYETVVVTGPGILLGAAASVPVGSITTGSVNAIGEVGRVNGASFTPHTVLFSGQVDDQQALSTSLATPTTPVERPTYAGVDAAASSPVPYFQIITPPAGRTIRMVRLQFLYQCSAAAGTRFPTVYFYVGGSIIVDGPFALSRTAGQLGEYILLASGGVGTISNSTWQPLPMALYFSEPLTIEIRNAGGAPPAGDTLFAARYRWEIT